MDSKELNQVIESVSGISLITPGRLENLCRAVKVTAQLAGDMAEIGVYRGGSARVIARSCPGKILHLFDTFTGLPYEEDPARNPTGHDLSAGRFAADRIEVEHFLADANVMIHAGLFPDTAAGLEHLEFSFVHVDCDLYQSAADAISWFWPRMVRDGIMFFDDYGCDFTGVTDAVREAFPSYQIVEQVEHSNGVRIGAYVSRGP